MSSDEPRLGDLWRVRNAAAQTLALSEEQMRRAVDAASLDELVALIDSYAPGLSTGPEWTRTFDPLLERLWVWRSGETMAELARIYAAKGPPWAPVANAFAAENGARIRAGVRQPAWARLPAFAQV